MNTKNYTLDFDSKIDQKQNLNKLVSKAYLKNLKVGRHHYPADFIKFFNQFFKSDFDQVVNNYKKQKIHLQKVHQTLNFVAQKLNSLNIKWLLGASGALMVHGIDIVPLDLDVFTTIENVKLLEKEFKKYVINPLHFFDQVNQKEIEFQMKINDIEVEICELSDFSNLQIIDFQSISIPVNSLQTELDFYQNRQGKEEISNS